MSIYVPDDMKERMDDVGDLNWSSIARSAFSTAMIRNNFQKEPIMEDVIERLRASKFEHEQRETIEGKKDGRAWAMKTASFAELRAIATLDLDPYEGVQPPYDIVDQRLDHNNASAEESLFYDHTERKMASDEYVRAFVEAAGEVWEEVEDQL
jgi:hypothetical protein